MRVFLPLVFLCILPIASARAGAPPRCDPEPTIENRVHGAELIVLAKVLRNTPRAKHNENTRTRVLVETVLKGELKSRRVTVLSCKHYKCGHSSFKRGERFIMFLSDSHWGKRLRPNQRALEGWSCISGFTANSVAFDPAARTVIDIFRAAGVAMPVATEQ